MKLAQHEIFLVLFSILYGVMLQSLPGGIFPLGKLLRGHVDRNKNVKVSMKKWGVRTNKELMGIWGKITLLSILFVNVLPLIDLWIMLILLDKCILELNFSFKSLIDTFFIFWSALGVFGFYRIYHAYISRSNYMDLPHLRKIMICERDLSFDSWAHLIWACIYILPGPNWFYLSKSQLCNLGKIITIFIFFVVSIILTIFINKKMFNKSDINHLVSGILLTIFHFLILTSGLSLGILLKTQLSIYCVS